MADLFETKDADYAARVRASFDRQGAMQTIGASLTKIEPGVVWIEMPWARTLTQQHGFLHAGMVATALDSACGYCAFTLMPADAAILTIEYKINLLAARSSNPAALSRLQRAAPSLSKAAAKS